MREVAYELPKARASGQAARPISTRRLNALLRLHLGPINLVVYEGPLGAYAREISSWGGLPA